MQDIDEVIRRIIREELSNMFGPEEEEEDVGIGSDCRECQAALSDHREEIARLKARVAELEKRPQIIYQYSHNAPITTPDYKPDWWQQPTFTCKQ